MATRLELAQQKLERLKRELQEATETAFNHQKSTNGQPMNDKRNGYSWLKKQEALENKAIQLTQEIELQKERIEKLEEQKSWKESGLNKNGSGLKLTYDNIHNIEQAIKDHEEQKEGYSLYTPATIRKYKKAIIELKSQQEKIKAINLKPYVAELIQNKEVTQWQKHPTIYFVKGLRKVAFVLTNTGDFQISPRYYPYSDNDKKVVKKLVPEINL